MGAARKGSETERAGRRELRGGEASSRWSVLFIYLFIFSQGWNNRLKIEDKISKMQRVKESRGMVSEEITGGGVVWSGYM